MWIYVFSFLELYIRVESLGIVITLCLTFWGSDKLFSKMAGCFYIPTTNAWRLQFLHILTNTCCCLLFFSFLFLINPSCVCEVVSHWSSDLSFPKDSWCGVSFHVLIDHSYIFLGEIYIEILCPFLIRLFDFLLLNCKCSLYILSTSS